MSSPPELTLRLARLSDAASLGAIGFAAWATSAFGSNDAGRADRAALLHEFETFGVDFSNTITVAELGDRPVGWGAREHLDNRVTDLWVSPTAQGLGVGAALLVALEDAIASAGFPHAELETAADNSGAVRFYQRQGYTIVWRGMKYSASLKYELDKVRFEKPLYGGSAVEIRTAN